jgi:hypothetical protein
MRLDGARCEELLRQSDHGVLSTVHPERGVDAVPACFVVTGTGLAVPIDRVKPKASADLQRVRNLGRDPRAALLCEHWSGSDWSQLWWVRASLVLAAATTGERADFESVLRAKYPQYQGRPFDDVLAFRLVALTGWAATAG